MRFAEAFERYLPTQGLSKRDNVTTIENTGENEALVSVTTSSHVTAAEADETLENIDLSRRHALNLPDKENEPADVMLL